MIMAKRKAKVWLSTGSLFGLEDKKPNIIFISWFPKSNIGFFVHINISSHLWQLYTFFVFYYTFEFNFHYHIENYHIFTMFENHPKEADFQTVSFVSQTFKRAKQIPNARVLLSEESLLLPRVTLSTSSLSLFSNMRYLNANIGIERANFIHLLSCCRGSMRLGFSDRTILSTDATSLAIVQNHRNNGFAIVSILIISVLTASNCRNCLDDWSSSFSVSGRNVGYLSQAHHIIAAVLSWQLGKSTSRVLGNFSIKSQEN